MRCCRWLLTSSPENKWGIIINPFLHSFFSFIYWHVIFPPFCFRFLHPAVQTKASQRCTAWLAIPALCLVYASSHPATPIPEDLLPQEGTITTFVCSRWINHSPFSGSKATKTQVTSLCFPHFTMCLYCVNASVNKLPSLQFALCPLGSSGLFWAARGTQLLKCGSMRSAWWPCRYYTTPTVSFVIWYVTHGRNVVIAASIILWCYWLVMASSATLLSRNICIKCMYLFII